MMAPTVVLTEDGGVELALGSAGSNRIRSAILQTIVGVVDHGLQAQDAVLAPRTALRGRHRLHRAGHRPRAAASGRLRDRGLRRAQPLLRRRAGGRARPADRRAVGRRRPAPRRRRGRGVRARRPPRAPRLSRSRGPPGAAGEAGDLLAVERSGSIPGARLDLRVTVDGRVACNRGGLRQLPSDQVIDARGIERELAGEEGDPGPAARHVRLAARRGLDPALPGPRRRQAPCPSPTRRAASRPSSSRSQKLTRDVARSVCGLPR